MISELFKFQWDAFDALTGIKAAVAAILIFGLMAVTGESWIATGLVLLFAWLTNVPGTLLARLSGLIAFALGSIALTYLSGFLGLSLWPNTIAITVIGFFGTLLLAHGTRAYMVGYVLICWAIYGPFLVSSTDEANCVMAILVGTVAIILTTLLGEVFDKGSDSLAEATSEAQAVDYAAALPYAATVALVLGLTTFLGWVILETDPTMIVGGAFFVIGFDARKTWVAGIARVIGILMGIMLGFAVSQSLPSGLTTDAIVITAFFLCFATGGINPALFMLFFMFIISLGWNSLDPETLNLTFWERVAGEGLGVGIAMLAIGFLHWLDASRTPCEST